MQKILALLARQSDLLFVAVFVLSVAMFIVPMPTPLIDTFIAINLSFSFIVLVTTLYIRTVLDISSFPVIILIGAVFRLALTISTARLVLSQGDAGEIISAFGDFVIGGNIVVGLVIFMIVALVQFIVVTKGAERIAEVTARFTLDAIPGKQLAIDGDLRNGSITAEIAQARRSFLERESQFYGAMDGAMRFVKGDSIASLVVVLVNLVGGLLIGVFQRGMSMGDAGHLYSLLSVGDGLVAQIPSMLTAISAGIVVSRVSAGDEQINVGSQVARQLTGNPRGLLAASAITGAAGFIPGFPSVVLWGLSFVLGFAALRSIRAERRRAAAPTDVEATEADAPGLDRTKYGDPFVATVDQPTFDRLEREGLGTLIDSRIREVARVAGLAVTVPTFQIDSRMTTDAIHLQVENVPVALLDCPPDRPVANVAIDIARITRRYVGALFSIADAVQWLSNLESRQGHLATEVRTIIPLTTFTAVTRILLDTSVTLSQPRAYLEALLREYPADKEPQSLAEKGRRALSRQIAYGLLDKRGRLPTITLEPAWEAQLRRFAGPLSPGEQAEREIRLRSLVLLVDAQVKALNARDIDPILLLSGDLRRSTHALLSHLGCHIPVVAAEEIPAEITMDVAHVVSLPKLEVA